MSFARLRASDWVAFIAAIALLFVMALDWYSTVAGEEARRIEGLSDPVGALGGEVDRQVQADARVAAEAAEKNAWQAGGAIDRVILAALLATIVLGVVAAFARAAGRDGDGREVGDREGGGRGLPLTALSALLASVTALLVLYRMIQEPGLDEAAVVKAGAPLALLVLGVMALASAMSLRAEDDEREAPA